MKGQDITEAGSKCANVKAEQAAPSPYFNADELPESNYEYVAWLDIMGMESIMSRSVKIASNFIFKMHSIALISKKTNVTLYPVMDGLYAASPDQEEMLEFLRTFFNGWADGFLKAKRPLHRFIVRGGLAFGPVIHGRDVSKEACDVVAKEVAYAGSILLGMPVVQAHQVERQAPPFGVFVHESARAFAPTGFNPLTFAWWEWFDKGMRMKMLKGLQGHYEWCLEHSGSILYEKSRIETHVELAKQYFAAR